MRLALCLVLAGCRINFDPVGETGSDGSTDATDGNGDSAMACTWTTPPRNVAAVPATGALDLSLAGTYLVDTQTRSITGPAAVDVTGASIETQPGGPDVVLFPLSSMTIPTDVTLRILAPARPLVILVHGDVAIDGTIEVVGPSSACGGGRGGTSNFAPDGGGGGGFGATGGTGGVGAGATEGDPQLEPLRGGCGGGAGGMSGAPGGVGGGAVQISTCGSLTVGGMISANGIGGAAGGGFLGGGGGGGSGGAILLEGARVHVLANAKICANGGSGGEGNAGGTPSTGAPGTCSATDPAITPNNDLGGDGGRGGHRALPSGGAAGSSGSNSGGGGGAVGRIRIVAADRNLDTNAVISPAPVP